MAIAGLMDHCAPLAVIARLDLSDHSSQEKTAGDLTQVSLLNSYKSKFLALGIEAAEFSLTETGPFTMAFVLLDNPLGHKIFMAMLADSANPDRHILRQLLELFAGNISLALCLKAKAARFELGQLLAEILPKLKHFGVEAMVAWPENEPSRGHWISARGVSPFSGAGRISQIGGSAKGELDDKKREEICALLPSDGPYNTLSLNNFKIGALTAVVLFAGRFADSEIVFSKFRDLVGDFAGFEPDRDIVQAFRRLKKDHKLIVKGEKIASILETAVAVNHEINNPLTAILGNTQLLLMRAEKLSQDAVAKIKAIEQSAMRIRQVTRKLLSVVEPITTGYTDNLEMLDIEKSSGTDSQEKPPSESK